MCEALRGLLEAVRRRDSAAQYLFVGDYVNRGPDSAGVIELLLSLPGGSARFCRGNHDDIFDLVLSGGCFAEAAARADPVAAFLWFMQHGLEETFLSYGVDGEELERLCREPSGSGIAALAMYVPLSHRQFVHSLAPVLEEPDLFVCHGRWLGGDPDHLLAPSLPRSAAVRHRALWERFSDEEILAEKSWRRTGYFGHTPVDTYSTVRRRTGSAEWCPLRGPAIVLVDTACALSSMGRLTACCAESGEAIQVNRVGETL